jgi:hypothetical protein
LGRFVRFLLAVAATATTGAQAAVVPLVQAHSHNDNERPRPLAEALEHGFCSIEADVNLIGGQLLVGHTEGETKPGDTLQSLYLDPLLKRVRRNHGRVYPGGPTVTLLIDIKTEAGPTWEVLRGVLAKYAEMLTEFRDGQSAPGAVLVLLSGSNPRKELRDENVRYAALDGQVDDLDGYFGNFSTSLMPQVSEDWRFQFDWDATRPLSAPAVAKLMAFVEKAHAQGRRIRFYAAPDNELAWSTLLDAGVDIINTNRLDALRDFLLRRMREPQPAFAAPPRLPAAPLADPVLDLRE